MHYISAAAAGAAAGMRCIAALGGRWLHGRLFLCLCRIFQVHTIVRECGAWAAMLIADQVMWQRRLSMLTSCDESMRNLSNAWTTNIRSRMPACARTIPARDHCIGRQRQIMQAYRRTWLSLYLLQHKYKHSALQAPASGRQAACTPPKSLARSCACNTGRRCSAYCHARDALATQRHAMPASLHTGRGI